MRHRIHVPFRPLFSVVAMGTGVLGGLGVLTMLQQQGSVYPTRTVAIVAMVLGLLWGIAVPTLLRWLRVQRVNHRLAARS
jgi:hypothetical protein